MFYYLHKSKYVRLNQKCCFQIQTQNCSSRSGLCLIYVHIIEETFYIHYTRQNQKKMFVTQTKSNILIPNPYSELAEHVRFFRYMHSMFKVNIILIIMIIVLIYYYINSILISTWAGGMGFIHVCCKELSWVSYEWKMMLI